jgi:Family of unknown function (DUF6328)
VEVNVSEDAPDRERLGNELIEMLNELRVQIPGVQTLFAFMLILPFTQNFDRVGAIDRAFYFGGFLATTLAAACLIAPSVYHRLHWRRDVRDKDEMLRTANRFALVGSVLLALAMCATVFVLSDVLLGHPIATVVTTGMAVVFTWLWYVLPLSRRWRDRQR